MSLISRTFLVSLLLTLVAWPLSYLTKAHADSTTVTFVVGNTSFTVAGTTTALSQVTLVQDHSVVGTTTADNTGFFSLTVNVLNPGLVTYTVYATDPTGHASESLTFNFNALANTNTIYSGLVLTPVLPTATPTASATPVSATTTPSPSPSPSPLPPLLAFLAPLTSTLPSAFHQLLVESGLSNSLEITTDSMKQVLVTWTNSWRDWENTNTSTTKPKSLVTCDINEDDTCNLFDFSVILYHVK